MIKAEGLQWRTGDNLIRTEGRKSGWKTTKVKTQCLALNGANTSEIRRLKRNRSLWKLESLALTTQNQWSNLGANPRCPGSYSHQRRKLKKIKHRRRLQTKKI